MAQDYDKIIKENFRNSIPFLLRVILGISNQPDQMEKIDLKLQYTLEREPDFLKKVKTENPENDYAIQVEFQSDSPPNYDMIARFLVYKGLILRIEKLPTKQFVFYVGNENPTMKNHYEDDNIKFHFIIVDFKDIDYELFLNSNKPEEVIFAILADFKKKHPKAVIEDILKKLQQLIKGKMKLQKFVKQLEVISKLRNLQPLTIKSIEAMPIIYDIKTDVRYLQGKEEGKEEGKEDMIINLLEKGLLSIEQIAEVAEVSIERVKNIHDEIHLPQQKKNNKSSRNGNKKSRH